METVYLTDLDRPEAAPFARLTRAELKRAGSGEGLFIAESANVIAAALEAGYRAVSFLTEPKKVDPLKALFGGSTDAPILTAAPELLEELTGYRVSRGALCAMERKPLPSPEDVLKGAKRAAVLEGLIDPANVGAIFRSAAALGMDAVLVTESCCEPLHRRAARVSMGAVFRVPWAVLPCKKDGLSADLAPLKREGFYTAALALSEGAVGIDEAGLDGKERLALMIGSEGDGLREATTADCDSSVTIPMAHGMDSLNAAAAAAVVFYAVSRR